MTGYQPVWRDGNVVTAGERDCSDRYEALRPALAEIGRPFTTMDLGAAQGYFSTRAAHDFDCSVTAVDHNSALSAAKSDRVTPVIKRVGLADLRAMPRHDVILALSILHHFADWRSALRQIRACREFAVIEVPHPDEKWMRSAASRRHLRAIHDAVAKVATKKLGEFERTGRDGSRRLRPMYLVPGTVVQIEGAVFGGSGTCSRKLPEFGAGLDKQLGYKPFAGSLNLRSDRQIPDLGKPHVDWVGRRGKRTRRYWFWDAWVGGVALHAMDPAGRGHGPSCIEVVAKDRLRKSLNLRDGSIVKLDVEKNT